MTAASSSPRDHEGDKSDHLLREDVAVTEAFLRGGGGGGVDGDKAGAEFGFAVGFFEIRFAVGLSDVVGLEIDFTIEFFEEAILEFGFDTEIGGGIDIGDGIGSWFGSELGSVFGKLAAEIDFDIIPALENEIGS